MSTPLIISIPHRLGKAEALHRLKGGLGEAGASFGHLFSIDEQAWSGDRLEFRVTALAQAVRGSIDVADDYVRLEVYLPWLLATLADGLQPLIRKQGTLLLEKK
jgi:putative polyhydroxyalkanoic acid system protein